MCLSIERQIEMNCHLYFDKYVHTQCNDEDLNIKYKFIKISLINYIASRARDDQWIIYLFRSVLTRMAKKYDPKIWRFRIKVIHS